APATTACPCTARTGSPPNTPAASSATGPGSENDAADPPTPAPTPPTTHHPHATATRQSVPHDADETYAMSSWKNPFANHERVPPQSEITSRPQPVDARVKQPPRAGAQACAKRGLRGGELMRRAHTKSARAARKRTAAQQQKRAGLARARSPRSGVQK